MSDDALLEEMKALRAKATAWEQLARLAYRYTRNRLEGGDYSPGAEADYVRLLREACDALQALGEDAGGQAFPIVRGNRRADDPHNMVESLRRNMDYTSVARKTLDLGTLGPEPTVSMPDAPCPRCGNKTLKKTPTMLTPYSGLVACSTEGCGYHAGFKTWAAESMFPIQKMPEGAKVFYHKDPEPTEE